MDFLPYRLFKQSFSLLTVSGDSPEPWQFLFQDPATPIMAGIINLHHDLMFVLNFIAVFVLWMIVRTVVLFDYKQNPVPSLVNKHVILETVWTIIPTVILIGIAIPSFALIYAMDEAMDPELTLKVVGHQWYWSYEFDDILTADNEGLEIESYMIAPEDLIDGELRLLQVDNAIALPFITHIRVYANYSTLCNSG
jgi:cytochrome c oxidase subunit 2